MSERSLLQSSSREDLFAETTGTMLAIGFCAVFYSFWGQLIRAYFDFSYWEINTTFVVYDHFIQNMMLGVLSSMMLGLVLAVHFATKFAVYVYVGDCEEKPAR